MAAGGLPGPGGLSLQEERLELFPYYVKDIVLNTVLLQPFNLHITSRKQVLLLLSPATNEETGSERV